MNRYTFFMKPLFWLVVVGGAAGLAYWLWNWRSRWTERKRASEERFTSLIALAKASATTPTQAAVPAVDLAALAKQKLLLEAAAKAGEAGEAVLSIQLYARLLSRFPDSSYAGQARAAVEAQKKKLAKT
jgi:membrane protein required for beta-lactamase induction